jgi:carbamoyltransferase
MRNYVGLACTFHDPALAVVNSRGEVVFAEGTERACQTKRALHCPPDSMSFLDRILRVHQEPGSQLVVARSWSDRYPTRLAILDRLTRLTRRINKDINPRSDVGSLWRYMIRSQRHSVAQAGEGVLRFAAEEGLRRPRPDGVGPPPPEMPVVTGFDHHLCHAAAACFTSPFRDAVCAVVDGYGETTTTAFYHYQEGKLRLLKQSKPSRGSLGLFYAALCVACGFDSLRGEEWKVMGLAPYGQVDPDVLARLRSVTRVEGLRLVPLMRPHRSEAIWRSLREMRPADLACTGQAVFEERMTELLTNLAALGLSENLCLGGGCALNSSYNGLILGRTPFKRLHVFAAPADDGNAVGAALLAYQKDHPDWVPAGKEHSPFLGSSLSREVLKNMARFDAGKRVREYLGEIHKVAARALAEGKIVGWVQGRAEFGPRALGNRSILADARRADVKDQINGRVKFREEFRPFAPSILAEHGPDWFEDYQDAPYMERTLRFRPEAAARVPGVVHVNGTGRLQTVRREWNERFHALVAEFHALTGVPLVLNTSFNVMGKPIAHSVEDALAVLHTTGLDAVALEDFWVEK